MENLRTVEIDVEQGVYKVNGKDISQTCTEFNLTFEKGVWSLQIVEDKTYIHSDHTD